MCEDIGLLVHCWWEQNTVQPPWKTVWQFPEKLNMQPKHCTLKVLSQGNENLWSPKNLHTDVRSNFIHSSANWNNPDVSKWVNV